MKQEDINEMVACGNAAMGRSGLTERDIVRVLKQHAKDIRCANGGGNGSEPGWYAATVLDYVADNLREIAARQPAAHQ